VAAVEKKWALSLLEAILNVEGEKTVLVSTENDTSPFSITKEGVVGTSKWSKELLLALIEKCVQTDGALLIRSKAKKGFVLYGVLLGRGGVRTLSVGQLGQLFFKTYNGTDNKKVSLSQLKVEFISSSND